MSFVKADNSTCNGIQPHPTLPFFITYGIDSTAKLWRATSPVDMEVDDSDLARWNFSTRAAKYEKSIVTDKWKKARRGKEVVLDDEELPFFPDETNDDDNDDPDHFMGIFIRSRFSQVSASHLLSRIFFLMDRRLTVLICRMHHTLETIWRTLLGRCRRIISLALGQRA